MSEGRRKGAFQPLVFTMAFLMAAQPIGNMGFRHWPAIKIFQRRMSGRALCIIDKEALSLLVRLLKRQREIEAERHELDRELRAISRELTERRLDQKLDEVWR
jgi:hypothetical protein